MESKCCFTGYRPYKFDFNLYEDTKEYLETNALSNLNKALKSIEFYSSDDSKTFIEYSKYFGNLATNEVCKIDISKY